MNLKDKHPKAWADFEEWFKSFENDHINNNSIIDYFLLKPFEMQMGVYLKYLDSRRLYVLIESVWDAYIFDDKQDIPITLEVILPPPKDRFEEMERAIEQAFKIIENQLL